MTGESGLVYDRYSFDGHGEWLMRVGSASSTPALFLPPLFEEMNRTRAFLVSVMRILAGNGFCCWLPDLPGTGESERALDDCRWEDWTGAVHAVADLARSSERPMLVASLRGGALLDDVDGAVRWRLAPVDGSALLRDLSRSGLVGGDSQAGYPIPAPLSEALRQATVANASPCRTTRLASDPKPSDAKLDGPSLWRRSEPSNSLELAALVASDIEQWASQCGIC